MMEADTPESARKASEKFNDRRVQQFFDTHRNAGKIIASSLGHQGEVAWDFYLFYPDGLKWEEMPPQPIDYMHQSPGKWANPDNFFEKENLKNKLTETMESLFL